MIKKLSVVATFLCLLVASAPLAAQQWAGRGRLQGEIKDEQGKPIEGAKLTFRQGTERVDPAQSGPEPVFTNAKGKWAIGGLAGGAWGVLIQKDGYVDSEGQLRANEFGPAQPAIISLREIPKEVIQAATNSSIANTALNLGDELFNGAKYAQARSEYEKAIEIVDEGVRPAIYFRIAKTYVQEKAFAKAVTPLEKATAIDTKNAEMLQFLASAYYSADQVDKAIDSLKKVLEIKVDDPAAMKLLVDFLVDAGREEEAKVYLAKLPQGTAIDPASLLNIGIRQFNEGKVAEAYAAFERVVAENPTMGDAYYYRGLSALGLSKIDQAKADFKKLLEIDPNNSHAAEAKDFLKSL